jgi:hypothetical protein
MALRLAQVAGTMQEKLADVLQNLIYCLCMVNQPLLGYS